MMTEFKTNKNGNGNFHGIYIESDNNSSILNEINPEYHTDNCSHQYINYINLSTDELIYLYARLLFPGQFMQLAINDDCNDSQVKKRLLNIYQNVDNEKVNLIQAYEMLSRYTYIPKIAWL